MTGFGGDPFGGEPFGRSPSGYSPPSTPTPNQGADTFATLSVVFAVVFAPVGAILGHLALSRIRRTAEPGRDRAIVGLTLSYAVITIAIGLLVVWLVTGSGATTAVGPTRPSTTPATTTSTTTTTRTTTNPPAPRPLPNAQSLLLEAGATTPAGSATPTSLADTYFVRVEPPSCAAAVFFKNSPLIPTGSRDHAEAAFLAADHPMSESADVYPGTLDPQAVARDAFSAVSDCNAEATGSSADGRVSNTLRLTQFAMAGDGVLVWSMSSPSWTCDYGLAATPHAVLMLSRCQPAQGFPMSEWANTRRQQILPQTS